MANRQRPGRQKIHYHPIRTVGDIEAIERVPLAERLTTFDTFELLRRGAAKNPDKPAMIYLPDGGLDEDPFTLTYGELMARFTQCANLFHEMGLGPTDAVALLMPSVPQSYFVQFGGLASGIVCCVNWMLEASRIADILRAAKAKIVIALGPTPGFEIWQKIEAIRGDLPDLEHLLSVQELGGELLPESDFDRRLAGQPADGLRFERRFQAGGVAAYVHSGGTTGSPKLAKITHGSLAYRCFANVEVMALEPDDTVLSDMPMFHIAGFIARGLLVFAVGQTMVIPAALGARSKNFLANYWKLVERYRISYFSGVPTTLAVLIDNPPNDEDISSFKSYASTGSAALPTETSKRIERELGVRMLSTFGATELTQNATIIPRDGEMRHGSVGIRLPYTEIKTVALDAGGKVERDCGVDEIGVVAVKGPGIFPGYVDASLDKHVFLAGGWLNTGDLGRLDADGYLWITGRLKDLIIRGGHNIDPSVIEETLVQHPAVRLAAAVGKPDSHAGELPVAFVEFGGGAEVTAETLKSFVRGRISERAANPADIFILETMPLTDVGKPDKVMLRNDAAGRVFAAVLAPLAQSGLEIQVDVAPHATAGTLATVSLSASAGTDRTAVERGARKILSSYSMAHDIVWK